MDRVRYLDMGFTVADVIVVGCSKHRSKPLFFLYQTSTKSRALTTISPETASWRLIWTASTLRFVLVHYQMGTPDITCFIGFASDVCPHSLTNFTSWSYIYSLERVPSSAVAYFFRFHNVVLMFTRTLTLVPLWSYKLNFTQRVMVRISHLQISESETLAQTTVKLDGLKGLEQPEGRLCAIRALNLGAPPRDLLTCVP